MLLPSKSFRVKILKKVWQWKFWSNKTFPLHSVSTLLNLSIKKLFSEVGRCIICQKLFALECANIDPPISKIQFPIQIHQELFHSVQLQCDASHSGLLLKVRCNLWPCNTILYHAIYHFNVLESRLAWFNDFFPCGFFLLRSSSFFKI